jgi:DNA-binding transcriptional MerR regulator
VAQSYWSREVADLLGIGDSTLRKYCARLEEQGMAFQRGQNNSRVFYEKDVLLLKRLVTMLNKKDITLEQAVKLAVKAEDEQEKAILAIDNQTHLERFVALTERIERLEELNKQLLLKLEQQQSLLHDAEIRRQKREEERDAQLMQLIRETQEVKRLTAATKQKDSWARRVLLFWRRTK